MENIRWYNIAVYLKEEAISGLLLKSICPRLLSIYKNNAHLNYFFCLDNSRGASIILYLEYFQNEEETIIKLYRELVQATKPSASFGKKNNLDSYNESGIFKNLSPGHVCYGLFKLKTIPFTHFLTEERNAYFSILKAVSVYFLSQTGKELSLVIENKFLFSFNVVYETCSKLISVDPQFITHYNLVVEREIDRVSLAIGKPIRRGLSQSYEKNRNTLEQYTNRSPGKALSMFAKRDFTNLIDFVSDKMIKSTHDLSKTVFIQAIFTEICTMLNLNNYLTCLYFIQCQINENIQHRELISLNEEIIK